MKREEIYRLAKKYLQKIADGWVPGYSSMGLCSNITDYMRSEHQVYVTLNTNSFIGWPHFSGVHYFPVPAGKDDEFQQPGDLYFYAQNLYIGEYGDLRRNLAAYLAENIEDALCIHGDGND